jgi:NAD(P)H-dependent FMN reductase
VGYGGVGGARAVEQLRLNSIELQMAPIRAGVHILGPVYLEVLKGEKKLSDYDYLGQNARDMLDQLAWWVDALKSAREQVEARSVAA